MLRQYPTESKGRAKKLKEVNDTIPPPNEKRKEKKDGERY
jgi:hypothetical protein